MLADMSVQISAARELIYKAARSSSPFPDPLFAAQAKIFAADAAIKVTNDALVYNLHGSKLFSTSIAKVDIRMS